MMSSKKYKKSRQGAALLVVLFIVMVITIVSLGFLSRSDVELACGQNMILRTQMDYLAESGLEHARGLILNPQDVSSQYWTGAAGQQLAAGSDDYYDLEVVRDDSVPTNRCNYIINCNSYRLNGVEQIGRSTLTAKLRLDPCIAYWAGSGTTVSPQITINGDVYCSGSLTNNGIIDGDVFASGTITGANIVGQRNELVTQTPVDWPGLMSGHFGPTYYIGSTSYSAEEIVDANHPMGNFIPSVWNPAGIRYHSGDLEISNGVHIQGMLVVTGDLRITGANNDITAVKNFPALLVGEQVLMKDGSSLVINGLAQIGQAISIDAGAASASIQVTGGLFINGGGITSPLITVNVKAAPAIASIETWPAGVSKRWGPAAGAFFRNIERK